MDKSSLLIILTGKTASGKDTIISNLLPKFPNLKRIITTTSRKKRFGEQDGLDYRFTSEDQFRQKIANGELIEYVEYGGNLYGTEKKELENVLKQDMIWKIDPSRAGNIHDFIKSSFPQELSNKLLKRVLVIYITVPPGVVIERLKKRGLTQGEIEKRMQTDAKDWRNFKEKYDYVVENVPGKLVETINQVCKIIENRRQS